MDRKGTLKGLLAAISSAHEDLPKNPRVDNDSESDTSILQGLVAKEGAVLTLPSLRAKTGSDAASFPNLVLKSALEARNPLKGTSSSAGPNLKHDDSNLRKNNKADQVKNSIKQPMLVDLKPTSAEGHVSNESFSDALKGLSSNLDSTVVYLFNTQLAFLMTKLGQKSIHEKGEIPYGLAKALASISLSPSNMFTEESDHKFVSDALDNCIPPTKIVAKNIFDIKKELDAELVANREEISFASMQDYPTPSVFSKKSAASTKEDEDELMQDSSKIQAEDSLGHVATITSIYRGCTKESLRSMIADNRIETSKRSIRVSEKSAASTKEDEDELMQDSSKNQAEDILGNVATITSIYRGGCTKESLRSTIADNRIETSKRSIRVSVVKRSAIFKLQNEEASLHDTSEKNVSVMPLTFTVKVTVNVAGEDHDIEFSTPGTISGTFEEEGAALLNAVEVNLDTKIFFELIIRQINRTVKTFISKQKPPETKKKTKPPKRNSNNSVRSNNLNVAQGQAGQYLTSLSAHTNANQNKFNEGLYGMHQEDRRRSSKRPRDSTDSRHSSVMESPRPRQQGRRSAITSFGGQPTEAPRLGDEGLMMRRSSIPRFSGVSHLDMDTLFRQQPMSDLDATIEALRRGSANGESNNALAEALRMAEKDFAWNNMRRSGGNSMAAAADAVRRAEAENNLQSLSGMSQMRRNSGGNYNNGADLDAAISAALTKRTSYSNTNAYSQNAQDAARMAEVEAAMNGFSGRGSFSVTADALRMAEIEAEMRRQGHRMQRNSMTDNEDAMRLAELESVMRGHGGRHNINSSNNNRNSMSAAADSVRLAEMESSMMGRNNINNNNKSNNRSSMSAAADAVRLAEMESSMMGRNNINSNSNINNNNNRYSISAAADSVRLAEMDSSMMGRKNTNSNSNSNNRNSMSSAADSVRLAEMESSMMGRNNSNRNSMSAAADAVRLAEMQSSMMGRNNNNSNSMSAAANSFRLAEMQSSTRRGSRPGDSMAAAAEAVRLAEMESSMRRGSRPVDSTAAASEAVRIAEMQAESRRRSSLTEAMRLVEMDTMRRSSAGTSMVAAAEAVRLAEMDPYSNQRRQSHQGQSHPRLFNNESLDNLAALMRRSNGPNSSMAFDAMNLAELERWSRRSSSGPGGGNAMSVAEEAARLAEMEHELTRQLMGNSQGASNDLSNMSLAMRNSSGRRVSFGPDTLHDQLGRFQR